MAYQEHVLVAIGGPMHGTPEIWGTSVRCLSATTPTQAELQSYCDDVLLGAANDLVEDTGAAFGGPVSIGYVKANLIGPDGKYVYPVTAEHIVAAPTAQGASGTCLPFQVTPVLSLRAAGRGAGTHGRMYLPAVGVSPGITGSWNADYTGSLLSAGATFLGALSTAGAVNLHPAIVSQKGPANLVSTLEVGSIPDTQRRRRNALVEIYASQGFPSS